MTVASENKFATPRAARNGSVGFAATHAGAFKPDNSLSVVGGAADGWTNPQSDAKNNLGGRKLDNNLTIKDIVDNVLRKPPFGFTGYNPKATV